MTLADINSYPYEKVSAELVRCCGSSIWAKKMMARRPFMNEKSLYDAAEKCWYDCSSGDWLEAFRHHPKIGDHKNLTKQFAGTGSWASDEQKGAVMASEIVLNELAELNNVYEKRFGFIFIVYATGKSADEMLKLLNTRIQNSPEDELKVAVEEQNKITKLRLQKLLS